MRRRDIQESKSGGWKRVYSQTEETSEAMRRGHRGCGAGMGRMQQYPGGKGKRPPSSSKDERAKGQN